MRESQNTTQLKQSNTSIKRHKYGSQITMADSNANDTFSQNDGFNS
jgi:hypothetical protein